MKPSKSPLWASLELYCVLAHCALRGVPLWCFRQGAHRAIRALLHPAVVCSVARDTVELRAGRIPLRPAGIRAPISSASTPLLSRAAGMRTLLRTHHRSMHKTVPHVRQVRDARPLLSTHLCRIVMHAPSAFASPACLGRLTPALNLPHSPFHASRSLTIGIVASHALRWCYAPSESRPPSAP